MLKWHTCVVPAQAPAQGGGGYSCGKVLLAGAITNKDGLLVPLPIKDPDAKVSFSVSHTRTQFVFPTKKPLSDG